MGVLWILHYSLCLSLLESNHVSINDKNGIENVVGLFICETIYLLRLRLGTGYLIRLEDENEQTLERDIVTLSQRVISGK